MPVKVTCESEAGGAVCLNEAHGVWASYAVATAGDLPPPLCLTVGIGLPGGRSLQLFVNRETGLVCVNLTDKDEAGGTELFRSTVLGQKRPKGRKYHLESLEASGPEERHDADQ